MSTIAILVLALVAGYAIYLGGSFLYFRSQFPALYNIILGKATFQSLPPDRQAEVASFAIDIINRSWTKKDFSDSDFLCEAQRYAWYALAMGEMGIPPLKNCLGEQRWFPTRKPQQYPFTGRSIRENMMTRLREESGIAVEVDFRAKLPTTQRDV